MNEELQEAANNWANAKREIETAKALSDQAERRLAECAQNAAKYAEILCNRVGANVTRRMFQTREGFVLVQYHSPTWTAVELVQVEPV